MSCGMEHGLKERLHGWEWMVCDTCGNMHANQVEGTIDLVFGWL